MRHHPPPPDARVGPNDVLAFLLELAALVALGWWGFGVGDNLGVHVLLGLGTPLAAVVLWGLFAAPKARFSVPLPAALAVKALVFGGATLALYGVGRAEVAGAFAVAALVNTALATADRRDATRRRRPGPGGPGRRG
ncbi:hypothetical protein AQ490_00305 [Wenjunlia vitaminophila]|uniref:DUF2568 domain-containing protein n=1 Tax=Wenjunlia vitaminophila TaxID=76728 RepID=A0A0T6LZ20_WENVI|nr:YrdB family protein [Wenjunlia vitaminophila]KRV51253.1 hypothetical protein AQ490_00305 [Wenjunlia vitaminophila]